MQKSTVDLTVELRARIQQKIDANLADNARYEALLQQLADVPSDLPPADDEHRAKFLPPSPSPELKDQLIQLAREFGVVKADDLPALFKAKNWKSSHDDESLKFQCMLIVRNHKEIFDVPHRSQFRLADMSNGTHFNKRPLVEHTYDALKEMPGRTAHIEDIAKAVEKSGYKTQAKKTALSTLIGQLLAKDSRFTRTERGTYRLR